MGENALLVGCINFANIYTLGDEMRADIKLYNMDCMDVMRDMKDANIDLTVTSPPYDNLREYNKSSIWNFNIFKNISRELYRVTKDGGVVVWVVADATIDGSETGSSFKQALYFMECGFRLHDTMIYEKNTPSMPDNSRYGNTWEYMFVFSKGKPKTFNPLKDKINRWAGEMSFGNTSKRQKCGELRRTGKIKTSEMGIRFNIWRYNTGMNYSSRDKEAFSHPAIFPEALAKDNILSWSNEGDFVFDPFSGSGTTAKMCLLTKRNFIGTEIDKDYYNAAVARLERHKSQGQLF